MRIGPPSFDPAVGANEGVAASLPPVYSELDLPNPEVDACLEHPESVCMSQMADTYAEASDSDVLFEFGRLAHHDKIGAFIDALYFSGPAASGMHRWDAPSRYPSKRQARNPIVERLAALPLESRDQVLSKIYSNPRLIAEYPMLREDLLVAIFDHDAAAERALERKPIAPNASLVDAMLSELDDAPSEQPEPAPEPITAAQDRLRGPNASMPKAVDGECAPERYVIKGNANLWRIARDQLGDPWAYKELAELNGIRETAPGSGVYIIRENRCLLMPKRWHPA